MSYTMESLKKQPDLQIRDDREYLITTHREASTKVGEKTHKKIGEVPDSSLNKEGTMVVLEAIPPKVPIVETVKKVLKAAVASSKPKEEIPKPAPRTSVILKPEAERLTPPGNKTSYQKKGSK